MTEQNIIKKGDKMNTIIDAEILKALLSENPRSVYEFREYLKQMLNKKNLNVNFPTVNRHIDKLAKEGCITIQQGTTKRGNLDKRGTKVPQITYKGLISLILRGNLDENDSKAIAARVLAYETYRKIKIPLQIQADIQETYDKMFRWIRPRINLENFDEDYAKKVVLQSVLESVYDEVVQYRQKHGETSARQGKALLDRFMEHYSGEQFRSLSEAYDILREEWTRFDRKLGLMKRIIKEFKRRVVKP